MTPATEISPGSREFVLRRLHSLSGLVPIGVFLVIHLSANSMVLLSGGDADRYQAAVNNIHALGPFLIPAEILGIFLPIAFHAWLGVKISREAKVNVKNYPFWCNWRYTLQRITGIVVLVFIVVHLWHMHWLGEPFPGGAKFDPHAATSTTAYAMQKNMWWTIPVYAIGIVSSCYHFATGLWTFLITWGITVGAKAQDRAGYTCAVIGVLLAILGLAAQAGFLASPKAAPKVEHAALAEPGVGTTVSRPLPGPEYRVQHDPVQPNPGE